MIFDRESIVEEYFNRYKDCHEHDNRNCSICKAKMEKEISKAKREFDKETMLKNQEEFQIALIAAPIHSGISQSQQQTAIEVSDIFHKQADMIQTVLELSDEDADKIKITDIPKTMEKVKKQANIGHMKELLAPRPGWLEKLLFRKG